MSTKGTATCACKETQICFSNDPDAVIVCNCIECQNRTGSAFGISAYFNQSKLLSKTNNTNSYKRTSDSGEELEFFFCANCGTSVWWRIEMLPNYLGAAGGCFSDPDFPQPLMSLWEQTKHPWVNFKFPPLSLKTQFPGIINQLIFATKAAKPIYALLKIFKSKRSISVAPKKCGLLEAKEYLSSRP